MWGAHEAVCRQAPMRIVCCYDIPIDDEAGFGRASAESINGLLEATEIRLEEVRGSAVSSHPTVKVKTVTVGRTALVGQQLERCQATPQVALHTFNGVCCI